MLTFGVIGLGNTVIDFGVFTVRLQSPGAAVGRVQRGRNYYPLVVLSHYLLVITAKLISILAGFAVNFAISRFIAFHPRVRPEAKQASPHQSSADLA